MKSSPLAKFRNYLLWSRRWLLGTPERALEQAYDAALKIKAIEDEHFNGGKISTQASDHGSNVASYFEIELQKYLNITKVRLIEFKASRLFMSLSDQTRGSINEPHLNNDQLTFEIRDKPAVLLEKLQFIDEVLAKYAPSKPQPPVSNSLVPVAPPAPVVPFPINGNGTPNWAPSTNAPPSRKNNTASENPNIVPRSILRTFTRLKRELDPQAEVEVVENFRNAKTRTIISIRFILLIILIPLLTQQVSKNFLIGPLVDQFRNPEEAEIFLNEDMQEEAFVELHRFEESLHFQSLLTGAPPLSNELIEAKLKTKADELAETFRHRSSNAIKNVFADLMSLIAFGCIIAASKREIAVVKSFMDEIVYGLSDSAKAFIIILFTDVFVGFHSPHGWEVILAGVSRHLGLPENHDFIFLFIATFPVILDTVFKYWIFRYLNRISPSAVATYRNMNE